MHTAPNQPSETANFTPPKNAEEALARIKEIYRAKRLESEVTMVAAQTKALETLVACMMPIKSTGDTKLDNSYARERNRQRLAAIQTLLHIRTVRREERMRKAMRSKQKAKAERVATGVAKGAMVGAEGEGHSDNGARVESPALSALARERETAHPSFPTTTPPAVPLAARIIATAGSASSTSPPA